MRSDSSLETSWLSGISLVTHERAIDFIAIASIASVRLARVRMVLLWVCEVIRSPTRSSNGGLAVTMTQ